MLKINNLKVNKKLKQKNKKKRGILAWLYAKLNQHH